MREMFILAPGLNGNELLRNLALGGVNCIGIRICGAAELARLALMRAGIPVEEEFLGEEQEAGIAAEVMAGEPYFEGNSWADIQEVTAAVRRLRNLIPEADEERVLKEKLPEGVFPRKNKALLQVCLRYLAILSEKRALDSVSLIRKAAFWDVADASPAESLKRAEFRTLKEFPLTPLEMALLGRLSGGRAVEMSLQDLFRGTGPAVRRPLSIGNVWNCYGAPNETETVLADIYSARKLDQCVVVLADTASYAQLFFDCALLYDLPITFGCGIPVTNANPGRLLSLYHQWMTTGYFGAEAIIRMLKSSAFDRHKLFESFPKKEENFPWSTFYEVLGRVHLTNSREGNEKRIADFSGALAQEEASLGGGSSREAASIRRKKRCIPCLAVVGQELGLPMEEFLSRYTRIRRGSASHADRLVMMLDVAAAGAIDEELRALRQAGLDPTSAGVIRSVLGRMVCSRQSEPGKLHVTDMEGAFGCLRKHVYVTGLSASNYPGSPKENYLLLDADLRLLGPEAEEWTADGVIRRRRQRLLALTGLAAALGSTVHLSYAGMNVAELKKDNPSSMIYELMGEAYPGASVRELEVLIRKVGYFEPAISASRLAGEAAAAAPRDLRLRGELPDRQKTWEEHAGKTRAAGSGEAQRSEESAAAEPAAKLLQQAYSPTALETFFGCPRRFLLAYVLGIPEPEEEDPFAILSALDAGTLAHALMEKLGGARPCREEFLALSEEAFDRFLRENPPLIPEGVPAVKGQFLEMMETAFDMDPHREVVLEETEVYSTHESGIRLRGYPDRVERLEDGSCLIVDFKTGRRIAHAQDDIDSCLQVVIYAFLMEQKGLRIAGCEYRYLRLGRTVTCRYDEEMKGQLAKRLELFGECLKAGSFPPAETAAQEDGQAWEDGAGNRTPWRREQTPCRFCGYRAVCQGAKEEGDSD